MTEAEARLAIAAHVCDAAAAMVRDIAEHGPEARAERVAMAEEAWAELQRLQIVLATLDREP